MPSPSVWAYGMAAPSVADPYEQLEGELLGGSNGGLASGATVPSHRKLSGSWKETFDPNEPGLWILLALLVGVGILHIGVKGGAGVSIET